MRDYNLILDDETCYGQLPELIKILKDEAQRTEDIMVLEGLEEAKRILEETNDPFSIYKLYPHPMGSFVFIKMEEVWAR